MGTKAVSIEKRNDHRGSDDSLPDLPAPGHEQATQAPVTVGVIVPD
jgi:hypothetical protein